MNSRDIFVINVRDSPYAELMPLSLNNVIVKDSFWRPRIVNLIDKTLPLQYEFLEKTGRLDNFRVAAGKKSGGFTGLWFNDSDVYKWVEATAYALVHRWSGDLYEKLVNVIKDVADAQESDGYINTFIKLRGLKRWENLAWFHELYCGGHLIQAAIAARRSINDEFAATIAIDYYGYIAMTQNPDCKYIVPVYTIVNGDPIAMFNTTKHPEAAQAFILWALTDGQRILLDKKVNRLPVNPDVWNTPEGRQRQDLKDVYYKTLSLKPMQFNDTEVTQYEYSVARYFKATLIDAHDRLVEVWKKLVDLKIRGVLTEDKFNNYIETLSAPLKFVDPLTNREVIFTKDYAKTISSKMKSDSSLEQQLMTLWTQKAVERYESILAELQKLS
jgi:hypothetical protein